MAEDPAVYSIECDCLERADISLPQGRSEDVHALAKGARTTVSRIGHANGSLR